MRPGTMTLTKEEKLALAAGRRFACQLLGQSSAARDVILFIGAAGMQVLDPGTGVRDRVLAEGVRWLARGTDGPRGGCALHRDHAHSTQSASTRWRRSCSSRTCSSRARSRSRSCRAAASWSPTSSGRPRYRRDRAGARTVPAATLMCGSAPAPPFPLRAPVPGHPPVPGQRHYAGDAQPDEKVAVDGEPQGCCQQPHEREHARRAADAHNAGAGAGAGPRRRTGQGNGRAAAADVERDAGAVRTVQGARASSTRGFAEARPLGSFFIWRGSVAAGRCKPSRSLRRSTAPGRSPRPPKTSRPAPVRPHRPRRPRQRLRQRTGA